MARAITEGAAAEGLFAKMAASWHQKRVSLGAFRRGEKKTGEKKTSAEAAAEFYGIEIPPGMALQMPDWLKDKAKAAIGKSFEGEWWDGIGETTRQGLENFIKLGLEDGWSIRRLSKEISTYFGGDAYPRYRANNIARTELGNAMNAGHQFAIEQLQDETGLPMGKEWVSVMGPTTRITHADADGEQTDSPDGLFTLAGYEVPYPAHDSLPPEERCNCQCTIISSFVMSATEEEAAPAPDIQGLDEDAEAELPQPDSYQIPEPEPSGPEMDPKIAAALDRLEALSIDPEIDAVSPPFKREEPPYTREDILAWRNELLARGDDPADMPTEKVKLSALKNDGETMVSKTAVAGLIQGEPSNKPGGLNADGLPTDLPVIVRKGGKLYIEDGHEELTALKLLKKTKAEVYLLDLDATGKPADAAGSIPNLATLKDTGKQLGGSTGAKLMEDAAGRLYVVKTGTTPEHLREEFRAEQAYRAAGVAVPNSKLEIVDGKPHKISEFIEGRTLASLDEAEFEKVAKQLQKGFAADALLANWDTVGLSLDNVIIGKDGTAYRIDVGGSLRYRAQGSPKGDKFGKHPLELWSLRDAKKNAKSAEVFGDMTNKEIVASAKAALQNREAILATLKDAPELQATMNGRLDNLARFVEMSDEFRGDKWKDKHIDRVTYHDMHADAAGVFSRLPKKMETKMEARGNIVAPIGIDENGKDWDHLRGEDSTVSRFAKYCESNGVNHEAIRNYFSEQADSSWTRNAQAMKHWVQSSRDVPEKEYYDGNNLMKANFAAMANSHGISQEVLSDTFAANQAYFYRFCKQVDFTNNDREAGVLLLIRTESDSMLSRYGLEKTGKFGNMVRGAAESFSLTHPVSLTGSNVTLQAVPHTRIFAHYFHERDPGQKNTLLCSDGENEIVADSHGCKVYHAGRDPGGREAADMSPLVAELDKKKKGERSKL